ncbi:MAG TPA: hypothetical protein VMH41_07715 [Mycobacteriales bacterium]|nr:hypothetical protein [Mycobacteriales bacterium]
MTTADVVVVTGRTPVRAERESADLQAALAQRGVSTTIAGWGTADSIDARLVVIRSTWDYTTQIEEFLAWTRETAARTRLVNPARVVGWNSHKSYLLDLARAGVPVVDTALVPRDASAPVRVEVLGRHDGEVVIKPAVSVGAIGALRSRATSEQAQAHLEALSVQGDVLVQPFEPEIAAGETSLVFFGAAFSHAVRKTPAAGDYRVQSIHGGAVERVEPSAAQDAVAKAALAAVGDDLAYARVDLVETTSGPAVMELELIEPELFLRVDEDAPGRLADHLTSLL